MLLHSDTHSRHQLLDDAMMAVKKAARRRAVLQVSDEARLLMRKHPDCGQSFAQVQNAISLMAARQNVQMRFDGTK